MFCVESVTINPSVKTVIAIITRSKISLKHTKVWLLSFQMFVLSPLQMYMPICLSAQHHIAQLGQYWHSGLNTRWNIDHTGAPHTKAIWKKVILRDGRDGTLWTNNSLNEDWDEPEVKLWDQATMGDFPLGIINLSNGMVYVQWHSQWAANPNFQVWSSQDKGMWPLKA